MPHQDLLPKNGQVLLSEPSAPTPLPTPDQLRWLRLASRPLLAELAAKHPTGDTQTDLVLTYIERRLFEPDFTIEAALLASGVRYKDFPRQFKKRLGQTPGVLVAQIRLATAAELLRTSNLKIHTIANLVGYKTSQGFQRAYSRHQGEAPKETRKNSTQPRKAESEHSPITIRFSDKKYKNVAWKVAQALWDEVEGLDSKEQAARMLEDLSWDGGELFEVARMRTKETRVYEPIKGDRAARLLIRLAETTGELDRMACAWIIASFAELNMRGIRAASSFLDQADRFNSRNSITLAHIRANRAYLLFLGAEKKQAIRNQMEIIQIYSSPTRKKEFERAMLFLAIYYSSVNSEEAERIYSWLLERKSDLEDEVRVELHGVMGSRFVDIALPDLARDHLQPLANYEIATRSPIRKGQILILKGRILSLEGKPDAAWKLISEVSNLLEAMSPIHQAELRLDCASIAAGTGRLDECMRFAETAYRDNRHFGKRAEAEKALQLIQSSEKQLLSRNIYPVQTQSRAS